jgi:hypothetical protein
MILPFQALRYTTKLSVQDAVDSLRQSVADVEWGDKSGKPFIGNVKENSFRIRPRFGGSRNSFMPYASGKLIEKANGTAVRVFFHPNPVVAIVLLFFIVFCAFTAPVLFTLGFIVFAIVMLMFGFLGEARDLGIGILGSVPPKGDDPNPSWALKRLD